MCTLSALNFIQSQVMQNRKEMQHIIHQLQNIARWFTNFTIHFTHKQQRNIIHCVVVVVVVAAAYVQFDFHVACASICIYRLVHESFIQILFDWYYSSLTRKEN